MSRTKQVTRREFLRGAAAGALAAGLARRAAAQEARAKVVVVTCDEVIAPEQPVNSAALRRMMDRGVTALAGTEDATTAWKTLVRPEEQVAVVDAGTWLMNVPEVLVEVARGVHLAEPQSMALTYCALSGRFGFWMNEVRAGLEREGVPTSVLKDGVYTFPGQFHTQPYTMIVMTPTLKSHTVCGVSGVVKHYGTMSKTHVSNYHPNAMETVGQVLAEEFGNHRHLVVVDALRFGKVREGPQYYQKSLIFGTDPVATDVIALEVYLRHCQTHGDIPPDRHRTLADTQYHAGIADRARIDVVELEV